MGPGVCSMCAGTAERIAAAGFGTGAGVTAGAAEAALPGASVSIGCAFSLESGRTIGPVQQQTPEYRHPETNEEQVTVAPHGSTRYYFSSPAAIWWHQSACAAIINNGPCPASTVKRV